VKLRTRILIFFALLGVLPVLALGTFTFVRSMKAVESLLREETAAIAGRVAADLRDRYALRAGELQLVAGNVETEALYRAHGEGRDVSGSAAFAEADAYLSSVWRLFRGFYNSIELRDLAGTPIYVMGEQGSGVSEPGSGGSNAGSGGPSPPGQVMELELPVTGPSGSDTVGMVVAAVRSGALLSEDLLATAFGRAGHTILLHRERGTVLHHPSRRLLNQAAEMLFSRDGWNVAASVLAGDSGSFTYRENDSLRVASFINVASPPWTVVVSSAVDEFAAPFARMRNVNLVVMLLVAGVIGIFFFLMTRRSTLALEQLTVAADDVARGELSPRLPSPGSDEVGRLVRAFGIMVEEVREMLGRVEETRHMAVMGEFASRVSHEIRTPLTSIKLNLQELDRDAREGRIPEDSEPAVRICLREVERLDRAVSSVLSMVRTHPPSRERCSLHGILADAIEAVEPQLAAGGVRVEREFVARLDEVLGDSRDLEGVFVNLLVNAGEAMPGGGTVRILTENRGMGEGRPVMIRVRVSDQGPGVPPEIRGKIFRPFVSTKADGTGFGLSVARRTVEEHDGRLELDPESGPGEGASFIAELPLAEGAASASDGGPASETETPPAPEAS
jgi:signal transduction histidine kinase